MYTCLYHKKYSSHIFVFIVITPQRQANILIQDSTDKKTNKIFFLIMLDYYPRMADIPSLSRSSIKQIIAYCSKIFGAKNYFNSLFFHFKKTNIN